MLIQLIKLQWLKAIRSVSLGRKLITGLVLGFFGLIIMLNILALGLGLKTIIQKTTGRPDVVKVLDSWLFFFFIAEMMYRFFLQKTSVIELEHYLHLPIGRAKIIHFLLLRSFASPFNLVVIFLFAPFCVMQVTSAYGVLAGISWLLTIILISWAVHWFMIWFKQKFGDGFAGILLLFCIFLAGVSSAWYGWFNVGQWVEPFFTASLESLISIIVAAGFFFGTYFIAFQYYRRHAYLEELGKKERTRVVGDTLSIFGRFGLAGAISDLELKLVLRHKRSRYALILSVIVLAYGLLFYPDMVKKTSIPTISIFVGTFITGVFIINYGQLFLSWNSSYFDFFLDTYQGVESLVKGKHLLFFGVATALYILSIPYVYFGWPILLVHTATFLFNIGINMHIIIYLALWKPKPIDINKSSMFNYEGVGAAQFLMVIPAMGLPYLIYLPFDFFGNKIIGLIILGLIGILGIIFHDTFAKLEVKRILKNKYAISSSFRQEL